MATSQNGWPALSPASSKLHTWRTPGGTRLRLRNGSVGFVLAHMATRFDNRVQNIEGPILDDWGFAFRPVRGYVALSNHASGTAMDLNATQHVLGRRDTFTAAQEREILRLVNDYYDDVIRWGGEYRGRADEMHFEIDTPRMSDVERLAKRLMKTPNGRRILQLNPTQKAVILS